MLSKITETLCA